MANEFYTLIVVPHAKARFRKIQVSVRLTKWVFGTAAVATLAVSGTFVHYARVAAEVHELRQLRNENKVLLSKTQEYEQSAGKLQAKVQQLQNMVTKLGVMAGLEHSLPEPAGVGGVSSMDSTPPKLTPYALADMDRSLTKLTDRSAQLEEFHRDQTVLLSSTPSVWPVRGYLSAAFGNRIDPFTAQKDFHPGIDISTPIGTKVQAPADGIVISIGQQGGYGKKAPYLNLKAIDTVAFSFLVGYADVYIDNLAFYRHKK